MSYISVIILLILCILCIVGGLKTIKSIKNENENEIKNQKMFSAVGLLFFGVIGMFVLLFVVLLY